MSELLFSSLGSAGESEILSIGFDTVESCVRVVGILGLSEGICELFETIISLIIKLSLKFRLRFVWMLAKALRLSNDAMLPVPQETRLDICEESAHAHFAAF